MPGLGGNFVLGAEGDEPKQFIAIPGGDHNDPQTGAYYSALFEFLGRP